MIDYNSFFELIEIEENEIGHAKEYVELRGLEEHILMAKYLASFIVERKPTYKEVATAFRYDKRIRRIVYKYIGLLEERFRACICNNFTSPLQLGLAIEKSLYEYVYSSLFSTIVNTVWSLDNSYKNILFKTKIVLRKNLKALVELRNAISHNRTIVNYRDFESVTLSNGEIGHSLLLNIKNMLEILPDNIAESCKNEINCAARPGTRKLGNQVEWSLLPSLVLKI